jgi:hypothetical protein
MSLISLIDDRFTDKNTIHFYIDTYEKLFQNKKNEYVNILEIGILEGGSIKLWRDYFVNGKIHAVDINLNHLKSDILNDKQITIYGKHNAYEHNFINAHLSDIKFDYLIDDGPHSLESMIFFIQNYTKLLTDDGVLVIEDVQDFSWIEKLKDATPEDLKSYIKVVDVRNVKNRYDDLMFIIDKGGYL